MVIRSTPTQPPSSHDPILSPSHPYASAPDAFIPRPSHPSHPSHQSPEATQDRAPSLASPRQGTQAPEGVSYRNEDSDSDWDASDREDASAFSTHNPPNKPPKPHIYSSPTVPATFNVAPPANDLDHGLHLETGNLSLGDQPTNSLPGPATPGRVQTNPFLRNHSGSRGGSQEASRLTPQHTNPFRHDASPDPTNLNVPVAANVPWIEAQTTGSLYAASEPATSSGPQDTYSPPPGPPPSQLYAPPSGPPPAREARTEQSGIEAPAVGVSNPRPADRETPEQLLQKQKNAFYSIKKIRWRSPRGAMAMRESPILIQNANGPCPLLALVNALVLSASPGQESSLINQLRSRETISLSLLIDAIIDDTVADPRAAAQELPDLPELYRFLVNLHTGMNVNPRFVPKEEPLIGGTVPGTFEPTSDIRLYGAFGVPLVHGWIPHVDEAAYAAFERSAPSYEDAQNLHFYEEQLERQLDEGQLQAEDEAKFMDLATIKQFLATWPTQLSTVGLSVIKSHLGASQFGILFRNDHFSTIFKEATSGEVFALVTDAGYAPHQEIVFESLVDVAGSQSHFYSGDFALVNAVDENGRAAVESRGGWTTVQRRPGNRGGARDPPNIGSRGSSARAQEPHGASAGRASAEQEDADLALAMQLQEEEEERQRNEQASRRRGEEELSQRFLAQDSRYAGPDLPPRRGAQTMSGRNEDRPAASRTDEERLPTYEQAAASRPFHPPAGHPASSTAPRRTTTTSTAGEPAYGVHSRRARPPQESSGHALNPNRPTAFATTHEAVADRREGCRMM